MRLGLTVAIALAASLLAPGAAAGGQDPAASTNVNGQTQAPSTTPAVPDTNPPAERKAPEEQKKAPDSDAKGKTDNDSATTESPSADSPKSDSATPHSEKSDSIKTGSAKTYSTNPGSSSATAASVNSANGPEKRSQRPVAPPSSPRKIVVRRGGAKEPATQISPGMTPAEAARERQNAEQRLRSTGDQLQQLAGFTDARHQETVSQIRNYMDGARSALQEGDVRRASTLAEKAHLLAEDLLKR